MTKSMTGFGRGEYADENRSVIVEIRTVNHRYADINVKMPRRYTFAEEKIKAVIKETIKRGKTDVSVMIENLTEGDLQVKLNEPLALQYYEKLKDLRDAHDIDGQIDIGLLASMPDVLKALPDVEDEEVVTEAICIAAARAAAANEEMRTVEGEKLAEDLKMRGRIIQKLVAEIDERAPEVAKDYVARMRERIEELIGDAVDIPQERILTEAAIFADKSNITEELVRLDSHMKQLEDILGTADEPVGKKLDFLVQEMNREANTIGSKANDMEITSRVIEIKSEVEKIREQIQNIE